MKKLFVTAACFAYALCASAQQENKSVNDNAYTLPEVQVVDEKISHDEFSLLTQYERLTGFEYYIEITRQLIEKNDCELTDLKAALTDETKPVKGKIKRKLLALEQENNELKNDLENYIDFGTGDHSLFKKEFNADLEAVVHDLTTLSEAGDLMAENKK